VIIVVFRHIHYLLHKTYSNSTGTWTDDEILKFKWLSLYHKITKERIFLVSHPSKECDWLVLNLRILNKNSLLVSQKETLLIALLFMDITVSIMLHHPKFIPDDKRRKDITVTLPFTAE
jgi:hypothetical protein